MYEIEKAIPGRPTGKRSGKPLGELTAKCLTMQVGDSTFVPEPTSPNTYYLRMRTGFTFSIRKEVKDNIKGRRLWRIA